MNFREAARSYFDVGWTAMPLVKDDAAFPKKPFIREWEQIPHEWSAIEALPWERADGLGILLGPVSANLAVIDLDDVELAEATRALFPSDRTPYWIRTVRKRGHLYLTERVPSSPSYPVVTWRGREIKIELKARGQQVAAPPTPGYEHVSGVEPLIVNNIAEAWAAITTKLGITRALQRQHAGYPRAWLEKVPEGERNKAVFVEACRLREAGMPIQNAIDTLLARVAQAYQNGIAMPEREIRRTVQSAYKRGEKKPLRGWVRV